MGRRSKSSGRWLERQQRDDYVKKAQAAGWRSRAVYKLEQLDRRDRLLRPGMTVVDLGAAPGGWSQYAAKRLAGRGRVLAIDLLDMAPLAGVEFVQGDFCDEAVASSLRARAGDQGIDLVLSDMAPNMSGVSSADQWRSIELAELARDFALQVLNGDGRFVVKLFQGEGFETYVRACRAAFAAVQLRKPEASRQESRELYLVAGGPRCDNGGNHKTPAGTDPAP